MLVSGVVGERIAMTPHTCQMTLAGPCKACTESGERPLRLPPSPVEWEAVKADRDQLKTKVEQLTAALEHKQDSHDEYERINLRDLLLAYQERCPCTPASKCDLCKRVIELLNR